MKIILFALALVSLPVLISAIRVSLRQNYVDYLSNGVGIPITQAYGSNLARSVAVDHRRNIVYVAGGNYLSVLKINRDGSTRTLHSTRVPNFYLNNVQLCSGVPTVLAQSIYNNTAGRLLIFRPFISHFGGTLQIIRNITLGVNPIHHVITKNCHRMLVALGAPTANASGAIMAIYFRGHYFHGPYKSRNIPLSSYAHHATRLPSQYFLAVQTYNFTQGIVPYYISLNPSQTIAYVSLKGNNAIAKIAMSTCRLTGIRGLGGIDFSARGLGFDSAYYPQLPSVVPHPVTGLYSPGATSVINIKGRDVILTANEGIINPLLLVQVMNATLDPIRFPNAAVLQDPSNLGNLYVLRSGIADPDGDGDLDRLIILGTRGISAFDALTMRRIADSGCIIEKLVARLYPYIFNANPTASTSLISAVDRQSILLGPRIGAITSLPICKGRYELVIAAGMNPGFLVAFTLDRLQPRRGFVYQSSVQGYTVPVGNITDAQLLIARQLHLRRPESLAFYRCGLNQLMLFAGATLSSTLTSYKIVYACPH